MKTTLAVLAASSLLSLSAQAQVVIVSAKNPISKLSKEQVSMLYLGQVKTFITGGQAEVLDLPEDSALRKSFYQAVTNKTPAQMKAYWSKQEFSGAGRAPRTLSTSTEVVKQVAENPKFIGYVDAAAVTPGVKVVLSL